MMFKTHLIGGLLFGLLLNSFFEFGWVFLVLFILGSVLPDIDSSGSKVGRKFGLVSEVIEFFFGHRGFFHSIFIGLGLGLVLWGYGYHSYGVGLFLGYLLHLCLDALTMHGIRFFWPFEWKVKGIVKTGGMVEWLLFLGMFCGLVYVVL